MTAAPVANDADEATAAPAPGPPRGAWPALRRDARTRVHDVLTAVAALDGADTVETGVDHQDAHEALSRAWERAVRSMSPACAVDAHVVVELLERIRDAGHAVCRDEEESRRHRLQTVLGALERLSETSTSAAIMELLPAAVYDIGFGGVIVSRIADGSWFPESVRVKSGGEALVAAGASGLPLTSGRPEAEAARRKTTVLVSPAEQRDLEPVVSAVWGAQGYLVTPLLAQGAVLGLLHAARTGSELDMGDRQVLELFGRSLGEALARTLLHDRIEGLRSDLHGIAGWLSGSRADVVGLPGPGQWSGSTVGSGGSGDSAPRPGPDVRPGATPIEKLTRREVEVLRRMAAGDTNGQIARRCAISVGTVKSHVKNVLRKLNAGNRAEAVSVWWQIQSRHGSGT